ncbi:MAG TPA: SRPBCC family protein [Thermoanaerobaculia bacterium]|jgi:hypothetical protein
MAAPEYRFLTHWRVIGTVEEVADLLGDARELPRWWPSVYLEVEEIEPGGEHGVGRRVRLLTKGWLPYTLRWEFRVIESRYPHGFTIEATGDLAGRGVWTFEQSGAWTLVTYDWRVRAEKPLLRVLSPILRPLLQANHRWAMRMGEESLRRELARRRAPTPSDRVRIPPPPPPTTSSPVPLIAAGLAAGLAAFTIVRLASSRRRRRFGG